MAGVVFAVAFSLTCLRTLLVVDHVSSSNVVLRATRAVTSKAPNEAARRGQVTSPLASPRQQAAGASAGSSPVRLVMYSSDTTKYCTAQSTV